jgi:hypothetical protein
MVRYGNVINVMGLGLWERWVGNSAINRVSLILRRGVINLVIIGASVLIVGIYCKISISAILMNDVNIYKRKEGQWGEELRGEREKKVRLS